MLSPADRIVEATLPYTLRPKKNDREKVIASALRFVIEEFNEYRDDGCGESVIPCWQLWDLIEELESTVTLEELSTKSTRTDLDAL
jgi:hypothetical protein